MFEGHVLLVLLLRVLVCRFGCEIRVRVGFCWRVLGRSLSLWVLKRVGLSSFVEPKFSVCACVCPFGRPVVLVVFFVVVEGGGLWLSMRLLLPIGLLGCSRRMGFALKRGKVRSNEVQNSVAA